MMKALPLIIYILKKKLEELYNANNHILKAKMFISGKLNPYKIYNWRNVHYIIYDLPEYDYTLPGIYEVELLKVNDIDYYLKPFEPELAKVKTLDATYVTNTAARLNGEVLFDGYSTVTNEMFVWGLTPRPTLEDNIVVKSIAPFSAAISGLTQGTKYYYRAVVYNNYGITYGEPVAFTTRGVPNIILNNIDNVTRDSFSFDCEANSPTAITQKGIVWSTTEMPTTASFKINKGSGNGSYIGIVSSLTVNTTYYIRAYAVNASGTAYSDQWVITTLNINAPTVTTNNPEDITQTQFYASGTADNNGAVITSRGFVVQKDFNGFTNSSEL